MKRFLLIMSLITLVFPSLLNAKGVFAQSGRFQKKAQKLQQNEGQPIRPQQFPGARQRYPGAQRKQGQMGGLPGVIPGGNGNPAIAALQKQRRQLLMEALSLTPDQQMRVREFARSHDDESAVIGRRLRQSRNALDRALMSETFNEALIKRLTDEFLAAQAEQVRLNTRIRSEFRSVLTPEQVRRFVEREKEIQLRLRQLKQDQFNEQETRTPDQKPPGQENDGLDDEAALLDLFR
jgi:Spy/CpxP family protein refolding chaperone